MKTLILLLISLSFITSSDYVNDERLIEEINSAHTTWTAKKSERFIGVQKSDFKFLLGSSPSQELQEKDIIPRNDLPEFYDARLVYPKCESLQEIRDQGSCGSCWAFSSSEVMSDRICIKSGQTLQPRISAVHLVSCCIGCGNGCNGGYPQFAFMSWVESGVPTGGMYGDKNSCKPYVFPACEHHQIPGPHGPCDVKYRPTPKCENKCIDEYNKTVEEDLWFGEEAYAVPKDEEKIMTEIMENGPVTALFIVYDDFAVYHSGVYQHITGDYSGLHAIKVVGWGVENGVKYWQCVNSWNDNWGDKGTFKIIRGINHINIEGNVSAGTPKL